MRVERDRMSFRFSQCAFPDGLRAPALTILMLGIGCESAPVPQPNPAASAPPPSAAPESASAPPSATALVPSASPVATATPAASAFSCGETSCAFAQQCVGGACCPLLQSCIESCCPPSEHCNVYQCYQPILCGPGLPPCGEKSYCERYAAGVSECRDSSLRASNREYCARMEEGVAWLAKYAPRGSTATGTCSPELPPHRMGVLRWYKVLGKSAM